MSDDKVIERVRKLLALANDAGANEHEAGLALERAMSLLAAHNLSMDEVQSQATDEEPTSDAVVVRYRENWRRTVCLGLGRLYFCRYYYEERLVPGANTSNKQRGEGHVFVGLPHNVAVAREMATYLFSTVHRLAVDYARQERIEKGSGYSEAVNAFRLAAGNRLYHRMDELRRSAERGELKASSGGTNLPAMVDLYKRLEDLNDEWLRKRGIKLQTANSRTSMKNARAFAAGDAAAKGINLQPQLGGASGTRMIGRTR